MLLRVIIVNFLYPKTLLFNKYINISLFYSTQCGSLPLFCYVLYYEIFIFIFYDCIVKNLDILFNLKKKIDLIWWDVFSCNFKYIFINEIGIIKKIVLVIEQINKKWSFTEWDGASWGPRGRGWGEKVFPVMQGGAGMWQDKTIRGRDEDSILWSRPAPLPSLLLPTEENK